MGTLKEWKFGKFLKAFWAKHIWLRTRCGEKSYILAQYSITQLLFTRNGLYTGPIHFHSAYCISLEDNRSGFCCSFFLTLWKPRVDDWHHWQWIVFKEQGLHRQLSSSDIIQFGVIWVQRGAKKGHNLVSGLHSSSFLAHPTTYLPTHHPYYDHLWYHYLLRKSCPKQGVRNLYTHTMIAKWWMNSWLVQI